MYSIYGFTAGFLPWLIILLIFVGAIVISAAFVLGFRDPQESSKIPMIVSGLGLTITFTTICLIPLDVFTTSQMVDPTIVNALFKVIYFVIFSFMLVLCFVGIPFAYFWYEETEDNMTLPWKIFHASKYAIFTLGVLIFLVFAAFIFQIIILFAGPIKLPNSWILNFSKTEIIGEGVMGLFLAALSGIGLIFWWGYAAYGMAALPISLIKGRKAWGVKYKNIQEIQDEIELLDEKIASIRLKYENSKKKMNRRDKKNLESSLGKRKLLEFRKTKHEEESKKWYYKYEHLLYPARIGLGIVLSIMGAIILVSFFIVNLDRLLFSKCGLSCGFIIDSPVFSLFSPLDLILTYTSIVFPIDLIIYIIFVGYFFISALTGLANVGIHAFFCSLYKVRFRNTVPQGLLTASAFLMLCFITLFFSIPTGFAPQYATFGSQTYQNPQGEWTRCSYDAIKKQVVTSARVISENLNAARNGSDPIPTPPEKKEICYFTAASHLVNLVSTRIPIYSNFFFLGCWIFIFVFVLSVAISIIRPPATFGAETMNEKDSAKDELEKEKQDEKEMKRKERAERRREKTQERLEARREENKYRVQKDEDTRRGNEENVEQIQDLEDFIAQAEAKSQL